MGVDHAGRLLQTDIITRKKKLVMARNGFSAKGSFDDDLFGDGGLDDMAVKQPPRPAQNVDGRFSVEDVKAAVVGSVGDVTTMAKKLGVDRVAMRRYIRNHPEIQEAIEDEILSAREQVMKSTFEDAQNGNQQARADFFRMTGGMFDKKDDKGAETQQLVIQFSKPQKIFKTLDPATGETSVVDGNLRPVIDGETVDDDQDSDSEDLGISSSETDTGDI